MIFLRSIALFLSALFATSAFAAYAKNSYLLEQLREDADRVLPSGTHYSLAVDAEFFKPSSLENSIRGTNYSYNYWHGNGYWVDTRVEFRPVEQVRLNGKFSAYQGSSSGGPSGYGSRVLTRFGLSLEDQFPEESRWSYFARANDLGRRTLGRGLILEERETVGVRGGIKNEDWMFAGSIDGTGGVWVEGEVYSFEMEWKQGLLGFAFSSFTEDENVGQRLDELGSVFSLYSSAPIALRGRLSYDAEVSHANGNPAALIGAHYAVNKDRLTFEARPQFRRYFGDFGHGVAGRTQQVFSAYDQMEDRFTSFHNIFVRDSNVAVYAASLNASWRALSWLKLRTDHELGRFDYQNTDPISFHFFKSGVEILPVRGRDDHFFLYVSNKWFNGVVYDSVGTPSTVTPETSDQATRPKFVEAMYFGFIARTRF